MLIKDIVDKYPGNQLWPCKIDSRTWKHASSHTTAGERVNKLAKYFPELSLLTRFLENCSLCKRHYNQIVVTNNFCKNFFNIELKKTKDLEKIIQKITLLMMSLIFWKSFKKQKTC